MGITAAELRAIYTVDEGPLDQSIKGLGGKLAAAGAAIGAAGILGDAFFESLNQEKLADRTAAALALTGPQAETAGKVAGQLFAGAYTDSMEEANGAVEAVMSSISGMRDASAADIEAVSGAALNMASVFGVDVQRSAQIAGQMITSGLAGDGMEAIDLLVSGMSQVPAAVREDILDATDEYGQFFAGLGYTGEQAMALLVDASAQGAFGIDKMGDAVKEFTIRSTDMSTSSAAAYEAIGLNAEDMANRVLAGGDTAQEATQQVVEGLMSMKDPAAQAQAAIALFGTPLEDLNTSQIPDFLSQLSMASGELEHVEGAAARMGDTLNDNPIARMQAFKQAAQQGLVDFIGNSVVPALTGLYDLMIGGDFTGALRDVFGWEEDSGVVDFLLTVRENVMALWPHVQTAGQWVLNLGQVALPALGSALMTVGSAIAGVVGWFAQHSTTAQILAGIIGTILLPVIIVWGVSTLQAGARVVAGWVMSSAASVAGAATQVASSAATVAGWVLAGTQSLINGARMAAAWVLAMGPVGWVIAAVVGLVALIVANWDTVVAWTQAAWSAVGGAVSSAWDWVKGVVADGVAWVMDRVAWFQQLPGRVAGWFGGVRDAAVGKLNELVSWVAGIPGAILGALGSLGSLLVSAGRDLLTGLWNGIQNAKSWLLGKIGDFFGSLLPGWARDLLGIHSPSTVFAEMGHFLMLGLAQGIDGSASEAAAAAARAAAAVTAAGSTTLTPAALSAIGNQQAQAAFMGGPGGGPLFTVDRVELVDGTVNDVAQQLSVEMRTRGGV